MISQGPQPDLKTVSVSTIPCYSLAVCYWAQLCGQTQECLTDRGTSICANFGLAWLGSARLGSARLGLAWLGLAWLRFAWLGLAWLRLASLGLAWLRLAWFGLISLGLAWQQNSFIRKGVSVNNTSRMDPSRRKRRRPTARQRSLMNRAHRGSSEHPATGFSPTLAPVTASIPPRTSSQSTAQPAVHHRLRPTGGLVIKWQPSSTPQSSTPSSRPRLNHGK